MKIKELSIKNFRSYGNNEQYINFDTDKGNLILLTGANGSGKSSIRDAILFTLFNQVPSPKGTGKISLNDLTNLENKKGLKTEISFTKLDKNYKIIRQREGEKLLFYENDNLVDLKTAQDNIISLIGYDYDFFKNFISISVSDFKNILNLKTEDKKNLIDKVFNLTLINDLNKITKEIIKDINKDINNNESEVKILEKNINDLNNKIKKEKEQLNEESKEKIENIENKIHKLNEILDKIKSKNLKLNENSKEWEIKIKNINKQIIEKNTELKELEKKLYLYKENNTCPHCGSNLKSDSCKEIKTNLISEYKKLKELIDKDKNELLNYENELNTIENEINELISKNDLAKEKFYNLKNDLNLLLKKSEFNNYQNLEETINTWESDKIIKKNSLEKLNYRKNILDIINDIFSDGGIKSILIKNIIDPINELLKNYLDIIDFKYDVEIDDEFNAVAFYMGEEINIYNILSDGQRKMVIICVLLAYLELIQLQNPINILFLDELFVNLDTENIQNSIKLFKDFAYKYKVNLILVHHTKMEENLFDKIINIENKLFSKIYIENKN